MQTAFSVRVRERGQITLPQSVRTSLAVDTGDTLNLVQIDDIVILSPRQTMIPKLSQEFTALMEEKESAWRNCCKVWRKSASSSGKSDTPTMRRVFVDANVLIAGTDSQSGASNAVLKMGEIGMFQLVVCQQVLDEAERNLRKKLPRALPNFAAQMARLRLEILPDPTIEQVRPWTEIIEAQDAPILCVAVASGVDRFYHFEHQTFHTWRCVNTAD